jgi:hypothetical protein
VSRTKRSSWVVAQLRRGGAGTILAARGAVKDKKDENCEEELLNTACWPKEVQRHIRSFSVESALGHMPVHCNM